MSLAAYDDALLSYLKKILNFDNVINSAETQAWSNIADEDLTEGGRPTKKADVSLPMVSFWRTSSPLTYKGGGNWAFRHHGKLVEANDTTYVGTRWRTLPITLMYQITIWSDRRHEVDDIYRELLMYLITDNPIISIKLEGMNEEQKFGLDVVDTDTSVDVDSFDDKGRIYTENIIVSVNEAQLFFSKEIPLVKEIPLHTYTLNANDEKEQ
jgi:hypothetical protein